MIVSDIYLFRLIFAEFLKKIYNEKKIPYSMQSVKSFFFLARENFTA